MSDALSFADLDGQHVDLLPARTVMTVFGGPFAPGGQSDGTAQGGNGGHGFALLSNINLFSTVNGDQSAGDANGGLGAVLSDAAGGANTEK